MKAIDEIDCGSYKGQKLSVMVHESPSGISYSAHTNVHHTHPEYDSAQSALTSLKSMIDGKTNKIDEPASVNAAFDVHQTDPARLKKEILMQVKRRKV